ncbi:unnamed protein product, partial [Closterium sp. NIES-54]
PFQWVLFLSLTLPLAYTPSHSHSLSVTLPPAHTPSSSQPLSLTLRLSHTPSLSHSLSPTFQLCSTVNTTTASFCINKPAGTTAGEAFLQFFGMPSSFGAVWFSFAALIGFTALFISLTFLAASRIRFNENKTPPASRLPSLPPQRNVFQKAVRAVKKKVSAEGEAGKGGQEEEVRGGGDAEEAQAMIERDAAAGADAGAAGVEDGVEEDGGSKAAPQSRVQFTPTTLSFHDLLYEVDVPGMSEPKVLLNSISGFVRPGTMTALMGSS